METIKSPAEHRVILHNTSWETYERLMKERGESRVPRFAYDRGELEIMSPSTEHESIAYYVGLLVAVFAEEAGVDLYGAGSTTFDREDLERGFEPDACFYVRNAERVRGKPRIDLSLDPPPDLVIEVDITSLSRQVLHLRSSKHPRDLAPRRRKAGDLRAARQRVRRGRREQDPPPSHERSPLQVHRGELFTRYRDLDAPGARVVAGQYRVV